MTRKTKWSASVETQKTAFKLPRILLDRARVRAMQERRTVQELIAEALDQHLSSIARACGSERGWEKMEAEARSEGKVFQRWKWRSDGTLVPTYQQKKGSA